MNLSTIRREFPRLTLSEVDVDRDPIVQFRNWLSQALDGGIADAFAMALSTVSSSGIPSSRMVLLKDLNDEGFVFFTQYTSRKGKEIGMNTQVALLFYWKELERQVRIGGIARKISAEDSAAYFSSRPRGSQISALISAQSEPVPDRKWLEEKWLETNIAFHNQPLSMPAHWGGYCIVPAEVEFFQGRENRLHDRIRYYKEESGWLIERLAP